MPTRLSILGLAPIGRGETASDSFAASFALAPAGRAARLRAGVVRPAWSPSAAARQHHETAEQKT